MITLFDVTDAFLEIKMDEHIIRIAILRTNWRLFRYFTEDVSCCELCGEASSHGMECPCTSEVDLPCVHPSDSHTVQCSLLVLRQSMAFAPSTIPKSRVHAACARNTRKTRDPGEQFRAQRETC